VHEDHDDSERGKLTKILISFFLLLCIYIYIYIYIWSVRMQHVDD
jgi:hypothetical protein